MNTRMYKLLSAFVRIFIVKSSIQGDQTLFDSGPTICVANHLGSFGPMALYATFSHKLFPWVTHEILDRQKCAAYLHEDFVEPELKLSFPVSNFVSAILGRICVSLMTYLQAIPVYKSSRRIVETMDLSLLYLNAGKTILIFPETEESKEEDETCILDPGFVKLAKLYFKETGKAVRFLPLAVNRNARCIGIGEPVSFDTSNPFSEEQFRIVRELENRISAMYVSCSQSVTPFSEDLAVS